MMTLLQPRSSKLVCGEWQFWQTSQPLSRCQTYLRADDDTSASARQLDF